MWPFGKNKREVRQANATDVLVAALQAAAGGGADGGAIAAVEAAAGAVSRAFSSAEVEGARRELVTASVLAEIGRNLISHGDSLHMITVGPTGRARLQPVGSWDVRGGADPDDWLYRCDLSGPTGSVARLAPSTSVVHCRYSTDPARPWHGVGPLTRARLTARLTGAVENALANEAGGPHGNLLPVPSPGMKDGDVDPLADLRTTVAGLKGRALLVETTSSAWGDGPQSAPRNDWRAERIGANPPTAMVELDAEGAQQILGACGVPPGLFRANADGTSQRESWRRFLHGTVGPLAGCVEAELRVKLDSPDLTLGFDSLFASDLSGRARAFQSLVGAGMDLEKAAALAGLMENPE